MPDTTVQPTADQHLSAARGWLAQADLALRTARRSLDAYPGTPPGTASLIDAIASVAFALDRMTQLLEEQVKP